ncbi:MAG: 50S ribosomal protein L5 [Cytophagales bacterium]|nr:50S ribosomal protein L5 [Cytophagales bacterium]
MYTPRLKEKYKVEILSSLKKERGYRSVMEVPRLVKICLNRGVGEAVSDKKAVEKAIGEISLIVGQRAVETKARRSVSNFKLREGVPIGVKVTLRRDRMYEFLDRLIAVALPRVRDFQGIDPRCFDGRGNCTLGLKEQIIFPEISIDKVDKVSGIDVSFVTTARNDEEGLALLKAFGFPFREN